MEIRNATMQDVPAILELCKQLIKETNEAGAMVDVVLDEDKTRSLLERHILDPDWYFSGVVLIDGEMAGALFGNLSEYYFGLNLIACDTAWYIKPKFRGTYAGVGLLKAFETWSSDHGAHEVCIGISTGIEYERTGGLLQRRGYDHVGGMYKLKVLE